MAESQGVSVNSLLSSAAKNDVLRQLLILVGIAASVAVGVAAVLWSQSGEYRSLYTSLPPERAAAVVDALNTAGIPYRIQNSSGAILVPAEQLHDARIRLAGKGLGKDGSGMAMLEQEQGFGVSEFMQSKKYHYALEQELASTIESLQQVRRARVHLAIPKQSVFVRDRKSPSASIMLDVYPGSEVSKANVAAIINLVAGSIGGLDAKQVTVVDQLGQQLSDMHSEDDQSQISDRQFSYQRRIEQAYEQRIADLIRPLAGGGRVRVTVAADLDFSTEQQSRESWNPDRQVVRSEQINEQRGVSDGAGGGVPGALSNQAPAAGGQAPPSTEAEMGNRSVTRNYEIERVLAHSNRPSGQLNKLSVAVLVDNHRRLNDAGEVVVDPISNPELERITLLVKDAVGFEQNRGDRVTVMAADFREPTVFDEEVASPPVWQQPWFANLLRQLLVGLALLFIVLAVLRPSVKSLLQQRSSPAELAGDNRALAGEVQAQPVAALGAPSGAGGATGISFEQQLGDVRTMVEEDPRRVAQVVNRWVSEDNGQ